MRHGLRACACAASVLLALALSPAAGPAAAQASNGTEAGKTYLLAIGVCPPYRKTIPVEVCRNAVKAIVDNVPHALGIAKENVISLTDEQSTGRNVLATLDKLSRKVTENDRLILYIILHGDAFYQWADSYRPSDVVKSINEAYFEPTEDIMVFWTQDEPTVPALALAQKDWMTVADFGAALDKIPGRVALILDSCSSGLFFSSFHEHAKGEPKIDYILTSSGPEQASNFDEAISIPLFASQLRDSLNMPTNDTFGEAVEQARMTTVLHATGLCMLQTFPADAYPLLFPTHPTPSARTHDGEVTPPLWYCAQVPTVVDYSGEMSGRKLYQNAADASRG